LSPPSKEANSCSASQVISHTLEELNIHYGADHSPPIVSIISQINLNIMPHQNTIWVISGFHSELVDVSVQPIGPIFRGQESFWLWDSWPLNMGPTGCPETSARNYQYLQHNNPEERSW